MSKRVFPEGRTYAYRRYGDKQILPSHMDATETIKKVVSTTF